MLRALALAFVLTGTFLAVFMRGAEGGPATQVAGASAITFDQRQRQIIAFTGKDGLVGSDGKDSLGAKDGTGDDRLDGGKQADSCLYDPGDQVTGCP